MFSKRLRVEASKQNWFGVAVDLVILILGVFLGIQVNNWNLDRLSQRDGQDYRERVLGDLESNRADLANRLTYYRDIKTFAAATLAALDEPGSDNPQAFLTSAYQASQITPRKMRRFTYDEALSTGKFIKIGGAATRERLANLYTGVEATEVTLQTVTPYREHIRSGMPPAAQEAVRTQCPEHLASVGNGSVMTSLPPKCRITMNQEDAARYAIAVRAIPELRPDLVRLMADLDVKMTLTTFLDDRIKDVRSELVAESQN